MIRGNREYFDLGEHPPFRPSKDRCQKLVMALILCGGKIVEMDSLDVYNGETLYNMKPHEIAILIRISLPIGVKEKFESVMGYECLTEPPVIQGS